MIYKAPRQKARQGCVDLVMDRGIRLTLDFRSDMYPGLVLPARCRPQTAEGASCTSKGLLDSPPMSGGL
jgi:hypothetical protein